MSDKTEQPTPRRLQKARQDGDSPVSGATTQALAFLAALALIPAALAALAHKSQQLIERALLQPEQPFSSWQLAEDVLGLTLPLLAAAAVAAAAAGFVQSGGVFAFKKISPDLSRANPFTGIKNLVSWQRVTSVIRSLVAALLVGWLAVKLCLDHARDLAFSVGEPAAAAQVAASLSRRMAWYAGLVGLALGGVDILMLRRSWFKRLMMTKDEVKREYKESEGDPEIKAARRAAHQELLHQSAIAAVKDATVVIVNPTRLATALRYDEDTGDESPRVLGHGQGDIARRMIDAARAYNVPIVRDVPVARALQEIEVGEEIPEALYEAVAEILREAWERDDKPEDETQFE